MDRGKPSPAAPAGAGGAATAIIHDNALNIEHDVPATGSTGGTSYEQMTGNNLSLSTGVGANENDNTLSLSGSGLAVMPGILGSTGTLNISGGAILRFTNSSGASQQGSLSITGSGQLDLTNNHIFLHYGSGPDPIASIEQWIKNGFYSLPGPAIISSDIATDDAVSGLSYGIGYADSADPGNPANLPSGTIEIMYTLLGDANLDGTVNAEDFTQFSHNLGQSGSVG